MTGPGRVAAVTDRPDRLDAAFPGAAAVALDQLLRRPQVADRWTEPSALPQMSVGALACHLGRQAVVAAELLPATADFPVLGSADEHYARAAWVTSTSPDDPVNDRSADDTAAALGVAALLDRTAQALATVHGLLGDGGARDVVPIPWQGWALPRDAFLLTRLLEIVVHSDDLATSVGVPTPEFPDDAFAPVRDLLVRLAVRRHGQGAVVGTLARAERARPISAF
jgi:hypothetical protein